MKYFTIRIHNFIKRFSSDAEVLSQQPMHNSAIIIIVTAPKRSIATNMKAVSILIFILPSCYKNIANNAYDLQSISRKLNHQALVAIIWNIVKI